MKTHLLLFQLKLEPVYLDECWNICILIPLGIQISIYVKIFWKNAKLGKKQYVSDAKCVRYRLYLRPKTSDLRVNVLSRHISNK